MEWGVFQTVSVMRGECFAQDEYGMELGRRRRGKKEMGGEKSLRFGVVRSETRSHVQSCAEHVRVRREMMMANEFGCTCFFNVFFLEFLF